MVGKVVTATLLGVTLLSGTGFSEEINPVLGKVGDFVLREADLERLLAAQPLEVRKDLQNNPDKKAVFIDQLLAMKAVAAKVRKEGYDRKPEVREQLGLIIDNFLAQDYIAKVVVPTATVSDEALKKAYKEQEKDLILAAQVTVRHTFASAKKDAPPEERDKARAKMESALQRLKKGEDFGKVATEVSEDSSSASKGGLLGTITAGGEVEPFERTAFSLKKGEFSGVVETPYGFHVIKVDDRKEERQASFDEAKEFLQQQLKRELEQQKAKDFVEQAARDAGMQIYYEVITGPQDAGKEKGTVQGK